MYSRECISSRRAQSGTSAGGAPSTPEPSSFRRRLHATWRRLSSELQFEFLPGREFATRWEATLQSRAPDGSTPLALAFTVADQAIEEACRLGLLDDRFRVVLITDGEPNCDANNDAVIALAEEWTEVGVETTVMGLPGSTAAEALLDAIARAGGTHAAQNLGNPSELDDSLFVAVR